MSEYSKRDIEAQGEHYLRHVAAMTNENLWTKSDIAAELAHRDIEIERMMDIALKEGETRIDLQCKVEDLNAEIERLERQIVGDLLKPMRDLKPELQAGKTVRCGPFLIRGKMSDGIEGY